LIDVDPDKIEPNPENPRLIFREAEMQQLLDSIREVGIQVPLTVFAKRSRYVLLDGERRWRCARRLNLATVPAIVQPAPGRLENILMMFNIHNVRENWELMPMARKLGEVQKMLVEAGRASRAKDLAGITGLSLPTVRRALELLELPQKYQTMLMKEAQKPRDEQVITADVFVEIFKARRAVQSYVPEVFEEVSEREFVDSLVDKYSSNVVNNVVKFRDLGRIARAERAGGDADKVAPVIVDFIRTPDYKIEDAFHETVEADYRGRDIGTRARGLLERLQELRTARTLPDDAKDYLIALRTEIDRLLGR
jgi:ParB family chromosome partitioning protein